MLSATHRAHKLYPLTGEFLVGTRGAEGATAAATDFALRRRRAAGMRMNGLRVHVVVIGMALVSLRLMAYKMDTAGCLMAVAV